MDTSELIAAIDAEIARLQQVRNLLAGTNYTETTERRKYKLSAAARARISAAQRKRWAQRKNVSKR